MKVIRLILSTFFTILLVYLFHNRASEMPLLRQVKAIQSLPAIGSFLNPFGGFWANAEPPRPATSIRLEIDEIQEPVDIIFDERLVPHIFARNEHDLYFAQGYIIAKYRLWQMDFITRAAAGRLSEVVGRAALDFDRKQRRIGMVYAAEKAMEGMMEDETSRQVVEAYTEGVNTYIKQLAFKNYPIEFKLLGYEPELWSPMKSALLLKYMAQDLSFRSDDGALTQALQKFGKEALDELFPGYTRLQDPIIPKSTTFDFKKKEIPKAPKSFFAPDTLSVFREAPEDKSGIGSNNWAVSAEKSASNYPLLSNDPHLRLNLPSIWFEMQLVAPKLNVYGVALPGSPGITIGFNQEVSWGVTNVASDVTDWYRIQFKDNTFQEYWHDNQWKPIAQIRIEEIKIRNGETFKDTILFTHHGPIVALSEDSAFAKNQGFPLNCALRWTAHDPSQELATFYKLNRAKNYNDYREALKNYQCPAQNFVFADVKNNIAITSNGKFPLKWEEQGKFLLDGSDTTHDWHDWIPMEQNPYVRNPERGFVSSANQFPVSDSLYPYYLHWKFASYGRGSRINERLEAMQAITADSMRLLQGDDLSPLARDVLPAMLALTPDSLLASKQKEAFDLLKNWNYRFSVKAIAPTIFKRWWGEFSRATWADDFDERGMRFPPQEVLQLMVQDYDSTAQISKWFDDASTPEVETLAEILLSSFQATLKKLNDEKGAMGEAWQWSNYRDTQINHLIPGLDAFSAKGIVSNGDKTTVNALGPTTGPSWRMVVALGAKPKAYVIYPGGQSGNPGSFYYDNFIDTWSQGQLAEVYYMVRSNEKSDRIISRMKLIK